MNKLFILFALLILLPATGISQTKAEKQARKEAFKNRDKYLFAARPIQKNFTHTLPFEYHRGQIIVPVVIAGETYSFMFDTGAMTVVSSHLKEKLGMKTIFSNKIADGSGQVEEEQMYGIGQVQLGPVVFKDVVGPALDMTKFEKLFCMKLDGVFGTNIMRTCHWKIDYEAKTLTFSSKRIKPEDEAIAIDFTEGFSGSPIIRQVIGKYAYSSTVDTGYNGAFSIRDSLFFTSYTHKDTKIVRGNGKSAMTLYESKINNEYSAILDSIYFGGHLLKDQFVNVSAGDSYLTGNETFGKFGSMILDWDKKKLYFPARNIKEDSSFNTVGMSPIYIEDDLYVGMVWENSLAAKSGVAPGDVILSMDGIPSKEIPRDKWCEFVEIFTTDEIVRPLPIVIRIQSGEEKQLVLEKVDLFE
jgi:Aspartyl protease